SDATSRATEPLPAAGNTTRSLQFTTGVVPTRDRNSRSRTLWGFAVPGRFSERVGPEFLERLDRAGINALILDQRRLAPAEFPRISALAGDIHLPVLRPLWVPIGAPKAAAARMCRTYERRSATSTCTIAAASGGQLAAAARQRIVDVVVRRVKGPRRVEAPAPQGGRHARLLVVAALPGTR